MVIDAATKQFCGIPFRGSPRQRATGAAHSMGRGKIFDDVADGGVVDRRAVDLDHLGHLGLKKFLLDLASRGWVLM
jgi:hypothetical protein